MKNMFYNGDIPFGQIPHLLCNAFLFNIYLTMEEQHVKTAD